MPLQRGDGSVGVAQPHPDSRLGDNRLGGHLPGEDAFLTRAVELSKVIASGIGSSLKEVALGD